MSQAVRYERRGNVGIITVDNSPVNAVSASTRCWPMCRASTAGTAISGGPPLLEKLAREGKRFADVAARQVGGS